MAGKVRVENIQGNDAAALGAIAAGCRFYAGYPITPSSEVAQKMANELPKVGGVFIQMEDEIASIGAVLGASMGGVKAMTATSGPGFSLMQENLGYGVAAEIPCVIVNVMRGGPSTGMPTRPAQGDVMQARWGTHGDHPIIVLAPASIREIFEQTVRAFDLSERLRTPVVVLYDEVIGHLIETIELPDQASLEVTGRKWAEGPAAAYRPYAAGDDLIPAMARPGDGYRAHTTGLTHAESGFPTQAPEEVDRVMRRLLGKLVPHRDIIDAHHSRDCDDAEILVVAYGIVGRAAARAVQAARVRGLPVGLFRPITLWPFPERALARAARTAHTVLVPEMNDGQLCLEVERLCPWATVSRLNRVDGEAVTPIEITERIEELVQDEQPRRSAV